jgi:hypothetical protein
VPKRENIAQIPKNSIAVTIRWPTVFITNVARYASCARIEIAM